MRVLSRRFRGKFLAGLRSLFTAGKLTLPSTLAEPTRWAAWLLPLGQKEWVVYAKPPFGGPKRVLKYLARYTHRVAISNARLVKLEAGQVTFRLKDYAEGGRPKTLTLSAQAFLRRFVEHVLPRAFVKIRHYGLLSNRHREARLTQCRRRLLAVTVLALAATLAGGLPSSVQPGKEASCSHCGSIRLLRRELPEPSGERSGAFSAADTS